MIELKLSGDFHVEVSEANGWREILMDDGVVIASFWDKSVPLTLTLCALQDGDNNGIGDLAGPTIAVVGYEEIDALRRYCEMILEHYKADIAKLKP